ncbi:MAG: 6-hydroxycyclohex-1-ene-1-carbonyl-CoA dehydrogenase [Deltaproteobacteria bacterium]|nr:6-hydroxycyclohex-1-ene-1-carbonyl-CoA dehydrogenase [Deltaproteobacteria bacterium]
MVVQANAWWLHTAGQPLERRPIELSTPGPGEAIVQVLACGLCHTDLGYADGSVPPKHALPLVLGHEVVGTVVEVGENFAHLLGQPVIVPAVLPCGKCVFCKSGRANACPKQLMPGNDDHGGFATHLKVPAAPLQSLGKLAGGDLRALSVVADAVSTAWQAAKRANLRPGDVALVVGAGGVGSFVAQIAKALGAYVVALDTSDVRLEAAKALGADAGVRVAGRPAKEVKAEAQGLAKGRADSLNWKIFECSGAVAGQSLAWSLLSRCATYVQVGYAAGAVELRLSNLMAFDGTALGTWGCPPEEYPPVLDLIAKGAIQLAPLVEYAPMSQVNDLLAAMAGHKLTKRMVLDPTC